MILRSKVATAPSMVSKSLLVGFRVSIQMTGDAKLQAEGKADKAAGKVQNAVGSARDELRK